jgi:hypothetical protein
MWQKIEDILTTLFTISSELQRNREDIKKFARI